MSPDLDEALCRDFPELYADRHADMRSTAMCWGFCCGDGWEPLIRKLSEKLTKLCADFPPENRPKAMQVKEKFGGLRFYISHGNDAIFDAIAEAEAESRKTCENCGAPGKMRRNKYWVYTNCDECERKHQ